MKRIWPQVTIVSTISIVGALRIIYPERPIDYVGLRALLDVIFSVAIWGLAALLAGALGRKVLYWIKVDGLTSLERTVFALPIGFGILAYGVLALGLIGVLKPVAILLWLILTGIWSWREWVEIVKKLPALVVEGLRIWRKKVLGNRLLLILVGLIFLLTLLSSLTPPRAPDALLYHLQGARLFLQAEELQGLIDLKFANYPFSVEMLFIIGLAFGSDTFGKLLHLLYAVCLVLGTFSFTRRYLGTSKAWIAAAILVGIPIFPFWASLGYTDMAWAVYEFLTLYALALWWEKKGYQWLILAGLMAGWSLGTKYFALGSLCIFGGWVLWQSRKKGIKEILKNIALFGIPAILVGSPWYIKNWLWMGNPIYPLDITGLFPSSEQQNLWAAYMWQGFGTGRGVRDYLLLPWNLYAQYGRFGTYGGSIEVPSFLFPLVLIYPWMRKRGIIDSLAVIMFLRFLIWAFGAQQTRFLLPLFPGLSILTSLTLVEFSRRIPWRRFGRLLVPGLTGGVVFATLIYSLLNFISVRPLGVVIGRESKDNYLRRVVDDYPAMQFIQSNLPPQVKVLMMWDGRGYYCDERCLPDTDHTQWTRLVLAESSVSAVAERLLEMGVTHLLLTISDIDFILQHDPTGQHKRALEFFLQEFRISCAQEIYRDPGALLFEVDCSEQDAGSFWNG